MIGARFLARLPALLRVALRESGDAVAQRARENAPSKSGALAASISAQTDDAGVSITATAPHATVIELGSYRRAPRPFLHPALLDEREALRERIRRALQEMDNA